MPLQVFIVLVFGTCCWLAIAVIEPVMRSFAVEAGMTELAVHRDTRAAGDAIRGALVPARDPAA